MRDGMFYVYSLMTSLFLVAFIISPEAVKAVFVYAYGNGMAFRAIVLLFSFAIFGLFVRFLSKFLNGN